MSSFPIPVATTLASRGLYLRSRRALVSMVGSGNPFRPGIRPPIDAELKTAAAVLVVWTANSVDSRWVRGEARDAADRGILVPLPFDGATLPIDVRAFLTIELDDSAQPLVPRNSMKCCAFAGQIARQQARTPGPVSVPLPPAPGVDSRASPSACCRSPTWVVIPGSNT